MLEADLKYKPYIDGLRAVAVILVIFFHLQPSFFASGYLGVDIFFVISGFVISQSLYHDYLRTGKINIGQFYKKRFKRLYPALLTMVSVTTLGYVLVGFLWDTNLFIKSSISSILAVSNLYFLKHGDDYFTQDLINPLLHTWSLGVEEQFYFVYPALLASGLWYIHNRKLTLRTLVWVMGSISLVLYLIFALNVHDVFSNFYFPTARFWELGIGCALFFLTQSTRLFSKSSALALPSFLLLCVVLVSHPIANNMYIETLGITFATAGIIYAGINRVTGVIAWFENKALVFIGKISYSLYLWHLPVIYFANLYLADGVFYAVTIVATIVLALVSYYVVEKPLRYSVFLDQKLKYFVVVGVTVLLLSTIGVGIYGFNNSKKAVNEGLNSLDNKLASFNYIEKNFSLGERIQPNFEIKGTKIETLCNTNGQLNQQIGLKEECLKRTSEGSVFFLSGDSHAMHFVPMLDNADVVENLYFRTFPHQIFTDITKSKIEKDILTERSAELDVIKKTFGEVYYVISLYLDQKQYSEEIIKRNLDAYLQEVDSDINIILIAPTPVFTSGPESCVILGKYCTVNKSGDLKRSEGVRRIFEEMAQKYDNVYVYNPYDAVCPEDQCIKYVQNEGLLLYRDDDHLSVEGSKSISSHFDTWFRNQFETN